MTPWTQRERALRKVIETLLASAHPHPTEHPTMTAAWAIGRAALADPPPPDPMDEALRLAITALETASGAFNAYMVHHAAKGDEVKRAKNQCLRDEMDAAIRAAKGGA